MATRYYIGTSGWHYEHWRGVFYPARLPKARWLESYAGMFATVELNNTFYRLPSEQAVAAWRDSTPVGFTFAVKASRYITHIERLTGAADSVKKFLDRVGIMGEKLGPVLYQLPPGMGRNDTVLDTFLAGLPRGQMPVFEFRHESWLNEGVFGILRRHKAGLCVFDTPDMTCPIVATSEIAYFRFHGSAGLYSSSYSDRELVDWAERIRNLASGLNAVYIYFNNDAGGCAPTNARTLRDYLGLDVP